MSSAEEEHRLFQAKFYGRLQCPPRFEQIFDTLPGVHFFVKDLESRLVSVSRSIVLRFGKEHELEIIGKTDYGFFPPEVARNFVEDDQTVFGSGKPIINRTEIWLNDLRMLDWNLTTKLPLYDQSQRICGLIGTVRSVDSGIELAYGSASVGRAMSYIRDNCSSPVNIAKLSRQVGLSERQLRRKFQQVISMTPQEFLMRSRLLFACGALLKTDLTVLEIALNSGFSDHSSFSRQFRARVGISPTEFRRQHRQHRQIR